MTKYVFYYFNWNHEEEPLSSSFMRETDLYCTVLYSCTVHIYSYSHIIPFLLLNHRSMATTGCTKLNF